MDNTTQPKKPLRKYEPPGMYSYEQKSYSEKDEETINEEIQMFVNMLCGTHQETATFTPEDLITHEEQGRGCLHHHVIIPENALDATREEVST